LNVIIEEQILKLLEFSLKKAIYIYIYIKRFIFPVNSIIISIHQFSRNTPFNSIKHFTVIIHLLTNEIQIYKNRGNVLHNIIYNYISPQDLQIYKQPIKQSCPKTNKERSRRQFQSKLFRLLFTIKQTPP